MHIVKYSIDFDFLSYQPSFSFNYIFNYRIKNYKHDFLIWDSGEIAKINTVNPIGVFL